MRNNKLTFIKLDSTCNIIVEKQLNGDSLADGYEKIFRNRKLRTWKWFMPSLKHQAIHPTFAAYYDSNGNCQDFEGFPIFGIYLANSPNYVFEVVAPPLTKYEFYIIDTTMSVGRFKRKFEADDSSNEGTHRIMVDKHFFPNLIEHKFYIRWMFKTDKNELIRNILFEVNGPEHCIKAPS